MIDTLEIGQRLKIKLKGVICRCEITGLDLKNDAIHVRRLDHNTRSKMPVRMVVSPPMIFQVWDQWNHEWAIFMLPSEEEAASEVVWEQIVNGESDA